MNIFFIDHREDRLEAFKQIVGAFDKSSLFHFLTDQEFLDYEAETGFTGDDYLVYHQTVSYKNAKAEGVAGKVRGKVASFIEYSGGGTIETDIKNIRNPSFPLTTLKKHFSLFVESVLGQETLDISVAKLAYGSAYERIPGIQTKDRVALQNLISTQRPVEKLPFSVLVIESEHFEGLAHALEGSFDHVQELLVEEDYDYASRWIANMTSIYDLIILPLNYGNGVLEGARLAAHIRCTAGRGEDTSRTAPILFLSDIALNELFPLGEEAMLLALSGSYTASFDFAAIASQASGMHRLSQPEWRRLVKNLPTNEGEQQGHHAIANRWGVYKLAQAINYSLPTQRDYNSLYFKKLKALDKLTEGAKTDFSQYDNEGKSIKALLIDDEADLGWDKVLTEILRLFHPDSTLQVATSYEEGEAQIKGNWDIIFLDLRLNEKGNNGPVKSTAELSGAKLLQAIKDPRTGNPGTQVIMLTASNKAWNMRELFDMGVDAYYVKESPEFGFSSTFSTHTTQRFLEDIAYCVKRSEELKVVWKFTVHILKNLRINHSNLAKRIEEKLHLAFGILWRKQSAFEKDTLEVHFTNYELAFLTYWSVLLEFMEDRFKGNKQNLEIVGGLDVIREGKTDLLFKREAPMQPIFEKRVQWAQHMNWYSKSNVFDKDIQGWNQPLFRISAYILNCFPQTKHEELLDQFITLNYIRNGLDFTHSNAYAMKNQSLSTRDAGLAYQDCISMLGLLGSLLTN